MNKDSLEMIDGDRVLILGMIRALLKEEASIIITHGTDTWLRPDSIFIAPSSPANLDAQCLGF